MHLSEVKHNTHNHFVATERAAAWLLNGAVLQVSSVLVTCERHQAFSIEHLCSFVCISEALLTSVAPTFLALIIRR